MCTVRAVAVLTPLGFGFKTTVVDGLAAGCHVIVHRKLASRLPAAVVDACIQFDPERDDIDSVAAALERPPPGVGLNERLRDAAAAVARTTLGATAAARQDR